MPEHMPESMSKWVPDRMSKYMTERMSDRTSEYFQTMAEIVSE